MTDQSRSMLRMFIQQHSCHRQHQIHANYRSLHAGWSDLMPGKTVAENEILRRRSQAWWTFMRNHAMTTVQSRNGHSWARDVLSPLRSRSRAFRYHLSANCRSVILGRLAYGSSITCCVMLRSVPTWSRMCCGTPRSLGRRSAAFSNTRFAVFGITEDV